MSNEMDILRAMDAAGRPPKEPVQVRCLYCRTEFSSDELQFDENCKLWVCPYCQTGHSFGHELLLIADQTKKEDCL